jgi:heat shock protein HslJ
MYFILWICCGQKAGTTRGATKAISLVGTQWALEEMGGRPAIEHSRATLFFLEGGQASSNGSCNRSTGTAEITGDPLKLGPLASTRMMCEPAASEQESAYFKALDAAQSLEMKDGKLLMHVSGSDALLKFHAATAEETK